MSVAEPETALPARHEQWRAVLQLRWYRKMPAVCGDWSSQRAWRLASAVEPNLDLNPEATRYPRSEYARRRREMPADESRNRPPAGVCCRNPNEASLPNPPNVPLGMLLRPSDVLLCTNGSQTASLESTTRRNVAMVEGWLKDAFWGEPAFRFV
jgi:hypothetical protein